MATPMYVYAEIAARYGVDPKDHVAVDRFFLETVPAMTLEIRESILEELLDRDGEFEDETA